MRPTCCVEECDELAVGEIRAQWSLFDSISRPVCWVHMEDVYQQTARAQVDGELPLLITSVAWDMMEDDEVC